MPSAPSMRQSTSFSGGAAKSAGVGGNAPGAAGPRVTTGRGDRDRRAEALARIIAHRRYPDLSRRRGIEGTVRLSFRVAPDGRVIDLRVVKSADPELDDAAREAVADASPLPLFDGRVEVDLDFRLQER